MRYTFHGLLQAGEEHPEMLRGALLDPQAVKLVKGLYGADSYEDGAIWRKSGCLLLAVALGSVLSRDVVLVLDEDGSWWHAAVKLDGDLTVDSEQYGESVGALLAVWQVEIGEGSAKVESPQQAARRLDADEKAVLPALQAVLRRHAAELSAL